MAHEKWQERFEPFVLLAALLVLPIIVVEESDLSHGWKLAANIANWLVWFIFAAEVGTMLVVAPSRREWARRHVIDIAIVVLTPPFLPRSIQAGRLLRLARIGRIAAIPAVVRRRWSSADAVRSALALAIATAVGGGAAFSAVEPHASVSKGIWWALTTMTTVGYGDACPVTTSGKVVATAVMLVGIGFVAVLTAAVAERFVAARVEDAERAIENEVELAETDVLRELQVIAQRLDRIERAYARRAEPEGV